MVSIVDDPFLPYAGRVVAPRSHLQTDAVAFDLSGEWDFQLTAGGSVRTGTMPVPAHWVLEGDGVWGSPAYTNVQYPFPVDPPYVPDDGPVGRYRRSFTLPESWPADGGDRLRLLGVESEATVVLNGEPVGMTRGSRLTREFDVTGLLRSGANDLEITVRQWSSGSYLEDQDQWWLPGIFRDVEILHRPVGGLDDVWLRADFDPETGRGALDPEIRADAAAWPVTLRIAELGIEVRWTSADDVRPLDVGAVAPWSAEDPRLYAAQVTSRGEVVELQVGFRRSQIVAGVWQVNGHPVKLWGVNRHEVHHRVGRVFDEAWTRADLALMKAFNVNTIRTSHYPPHPRVLDIADELGFYVMLENDYETHGFVFDGWAGNPSDDPRWADALMDRQVRTVERDKNHACVIAWSLGNEAATGVNLAANSAWVHRRDPSRPVHYEGDHEADYTDVYSRMYPTTDEVDLVLNQSSGPVAAATHDANRVSAAQAAHLRTQPYFLCEYVHAMGTGPGGISGYVDAMTHPRHSGGCVWEWRDHALDRVLPDGRTALGYGGDFGEAVHDGNFVCDGLVDAHSLPSAGLVAWANAVAPVIAVPDGSGSITVTSRLTQRPIAGLAVAWEAVSPTEAVCGEFAVPTLSPGETVVLAVPELHAALAQAAAVTAAVLDPHVPGLAPRAPREVEPASGGLLLPRVGETVPDGRRVMSVRQWVGAAAVPAPAPGGSAALAEAFLRSLRPTLFRAPTDNDRGGHPSDADLWADARLHLLEHRLALSEPGRQVIVSGVPSRQRRLTTELIWDDQDAPRVTATFSFDGDWPEALPRIGLAAALPADPWGSAHVTWWGLGPSENYSDMEEGARLGTFQGSIDDLWGPNIRPQEGGHRGEVGSVALEVAARRLTITFVPTATATPGFSVCRWSPLQLDQATHPEELPSSDSVWLTVDARMAGIGTASCGPGTAQQYRVAPDTVTMEFVLGIV